MERLKGKVAIVTGSSKGIGNAIAQAFSKEGAKVVLAARTYGQINDLKDMIEKKGGDALAIQVDVRDEKQIKLMVNTVIKEYGKIDILVNNAGLPMYGYAVDDGSEEARKRFYAIIETNLIAYWYMVHHTVRYMKKNRSGSIINISSIRGKGGLANDTAYCMAKGGVDQLTRSLTVELAPFSIRVNSITPGAIQVELGHWVRSRYGDKAHITYTSKFKDVHLMGMTLDQPLETIGRPEDIAYAAVYLASDEARFTTGADLSVDGGLLCQLAEPNALNLKGLCEYYKQSQSMRKWLESLE